MGHYIPNSDAEKQAMLDSLGLTSEDQLFDHLPAETRLAELDIPEGRSELEVRQMVEDMAAKNRLFRSIFRGAGSYNHFIPSIVKSVTSKEEFVTA